MVSDTIQEFEGIRYYRCGRYFQRKGVRLHRVVYERHNGSIPQGCHIHHVDDDPRNNALDNLALLLRSIILAHHGKRSHISAAARSAARQWQQISRWSRVAQKALAPVDWRGCCSARCKNLRPLREIFRGKRYRGKSRTVLPSQLQGQCAASPSSQ